MTLYQDIFKLFYPNFDVFIDLLSLTKISLWQHCVLSWQRFKTNRQVIAMAENSRPISRVGVEDRPRTRWRRDERPMTRAYAEDRPSITDLNQILQRQTPAGDDRPTSRRGAKDDRSSVNY